MNRVVIRIRLVVALVASVADNLSKAGWSLGWLSAQELKGAERSWIVDAHGYGKRFIVRADEILTAFVELERALPPQNGSSHIKESAT